MKKILITGGTGFIGQNLIKKLVKKDYTIHVLSRKKRYIKSAKVFWWNPSNQFIDEKALEGVTDIIHLAGSNILKRKWNNKNKARLVKSRIKPLEILYKAVHKEKNHLNSFTSASAIGYYGNVTSKAIFDETTPIQKEDFITYLCKKWEEKADIFSQITRVNKVRIGIVLGDGGILEKIKQRMILSPLGNGKQWMPWISIDDLTDIFIHLLENKTLSGIYNATSPHPVTNKQFTNALARKLHKPVLPVMPAFALKMILGKRAELLLKGTRISSEKIVQTGFRFNDTDLEKTLGKYLE